MSSRTTKEQKQFLVVFPTLVLFFYPLFHAMVREQLGIWSNLGLLVTLTALLASLTIAANQSLLLSIAVVNGFSFLFFFAFVFDSDLRYRTGRKAGVLQSLCIRWLPRIISIAVSLFALFLIFVSTSSESIVKIGFGSFGELQLDAASSVWISCPLVAWVAIQILIYLKFWNSSVLDYIGKTN